MAASQGPRRRMTTLLRWMFLLDGVGAFALSLLTVCKCPTWLNWVVGMVVPEIALWLAILPVTFAVGAWLVRRGNRAIAGVTIALCLIATVLALKPAAQAWSLGRELPARMTAAFGEGATSPRKPFSLAVALWPRDPRPVVIRTMDYAPSLPLDFYPPVADVRAAPAPCVIVIHGGSWVHGNRMDVGTKRSLNDYLARRGYAVASIDYRLCPQFPWPAQRDDLLAAIAFLRAHAKELEIDPARLVLLGRSAGAQMATATAYAAHDPGIRGVISFYTPTDFRMTWESAAHGRGLDHRLNLEWFLGGTPDTAPANYESASAALLVSSNAPPTLILQGRLDVNVFAEHAELLAAKLAAARVPHALIELPWGAHAFDLVSFNSPGGQIATYAVESFLAAVTR